MKNNWLHCFLLIGVIIVQASAVPLSVLIYSKYIINFKLYSIIGPDERIQGWEFTHLISEQIARFLPKNERMSDSLKKMSNSLIFGELPD